MRVYWSRSAKNHKRMHKFNTHHIWTSWLLKSKKHSVHKRNDKATERPIPAHKRIVVSNLHNKKLNSLFSYFMLKLLLRLCFHLWCCVHRCVWVTHNTTGCLTDMREELGNASHVHVCVCIKGEIAKVK